VTYVLGKVDDADWAKDLMRKRTRRKKERRTEGDARRGRVHVSGGEGRKEEMMMMLILMRSPSVRRAVK